MIIGKTRTNQPVESVEGFSVGTKLYLHKITDTDDAGMGIISTSNVEITENNKDTELLKALQGVVLWTYDGTNWTLPRNATGLVWYINSNGHLTGGQMVSNFPIANDVVTPL